MYLVAAVVENSLKVREEAGRQKRWKLHYRQEILVPWVVAAQAMQRHQTRDSKGTNRITVRLDAGFDRSQG